MKRIEGSDSRQKMLSLGKGNPLTEKIKNSLRSDHANIDSRISAKFRGNLMCGIPQRKKGLHFAHYSRAPGTIPAKIL